MMSKIIVWLRTDFIRLKFRNYVMKKIMFVVLIVIALVVVILRINLPQNDVSNYFTDDHEMSIFEKKMVELMLNDAVAEWQYIDLYTSHNKIPIKEKVLY